MALQRQIMYPTSRLYAELFGIGLKNVVMCTGISTKFIIAQDIVKQKEFENALLVNEDERIPEGTIGRTDTIDQGVEAAFDCRPEGDFRSNAALCRVSSDGRSFHRESLQAALHPCMFRKPEKRMLQQRRDHYLLGRLGRKRHEQQCTATGAIGKCHSNPVFFIQMHLSDADGMYLADSAIGLRVFCVRYHPTRTVGPRRGDGGTMANLSVTIQAISMARSTCFVRHT